MANTDDFTFCPVGVRDDQDSIETQKVVQDISGIKLEDKSSTSVSSSQGSVLWNDMSLSNAASEKQETVGSLTFTVTDASTRKQVNESRSQGTVANAGSSASMEKKKPAPRAKVPFEKGYSQMDWMKLTRTHPDLAGSNSVLDMPHVGIMLNLDMEKNN